MAQAEPSDQMVREFLDMGFDMDEKEARARLKANNLNMETAISEFFDAPPTTKYEGPAWDSSLHAADREGYYDPGSSTGFHIQSADDIPSERQSQHLNFGGGASKAPSRVPSPHPSFGGVANDQDPEIRRAIAASLGQAIDLTGEQESGVTDSRPVFGPAQRDSYDGNWEMVLAPKSATQSSEPEPACRKRDLGAPAFLKPGTGNHCLGALLTIYHEIPLLREMFLDRLDTFPEYGASTDWWTGKAIEIPVVNDEEDPLQAEKEFKQELQRLMAFLDKTDRSYGSVEALASSQAVRDTYKPPTNSLETATLEVYRRLLRNNPEKHQKLFSRPYDGTEETQGFAIFELEFPSDDSTDETIYDLADAVMWPGGCLDLDTAPFISHIAEVVSFQLTKWTIHKKTGVTFPAVWYPDRYLEPAKEAAWRMRCQKPPIQTKIKELCDLENKLIGPRERAGQKFTVHEMFHAALRHDVGQVKKGNVAEHEHAMALEYPSKTKNLSAQLVRLLESIDRKVITLNEEKDRCKAKLRELSRLYTEPTDESDQPNLHRYTLRGVCTDKNTLYIFRKAEPSLHDIDLGDDYSKSNHEQWWRIHYASLDSHPATVEKTTEERVLKAASFKSEAGGPLVVYASDKAMQWPSAVLPDALEAFVKRDNTFFKSEFPTDMNSPPPPTPKSPGKRKFDERSDTSDDLPALIRTSPDRNRNHVIVSEKEINARDEPFAVYDSSQFGAEVTLGVDPYSNKGQEMRERGTLRMASGSQTHSTQSSSTLDHMDLDEVIEDNNVAVESKAVRRVDFADR